MNSYTSGKWAERVAEKHFESLGYQIISVCASIGPDLVIEKEGVCQSVEVKRAFKSGYTWEVGSVYPARKGDDLIAVVLPNASVLVRPMSEHLASGSGRKSVHRLIVDQFPEYAERPSRKFAEPLRGHSYTPEEAEEMKRRILGGAA